MSLPKSLLLKHSCMYAKRGGVAAYPKTLFTTFHRFPWLNSTLANVSVIPVVAQLLYYNEIHFIQVYRKRWTGFETAIT